MIDRFGQRPAIRGRSVDGRSTQKLAAQVLQGWMAAVGRDATSNLLSSAPETGRSSFASRKLPDAIECSRPKGDGRAVGRSTAGFRVEQSLGAPLHQWTVGAVVDRARAPRRVRYLYYETRRPYTKTQVSIIYDGRSSPLGMPGGDGITMMEFVTGWRDHDA